MRAPKSLSRLSAITEEKDAAHGLAFPWWIPFFCLAGQTTFILVALAQRDGLTPFYITVSMALVTLPSTFQLFSAWWIPWWMESISVLAGVALVLSLPASGQGAADAVSVVIVFVVGRYTATEGFRIGSVVAIVAGVMLAVASAFGHLESLPVHLLTTALGLAVGYMLHAQSRALAAEREARAAEHTRATLAERNRIAREIHDLVAHSLSVTMLHITGARRVLADGDVDEAIDALRDAERVGRQAMNDIRQTVSELAGEGDPHRSLPSVEDIPALVEGVRDAGLAAGYSVTGDTTRLAQSAGLGLYRIVQESLANVAKHAPGSPAHVNLIVGPAEAQLTVRSTRTLTDETHDGSGTGISGMKARASQLKGTISARPVGDDWVVDVSVPVSADVVAADGCVISRGINTLGGERTST